jgi:hypothetical protein
LFGSIDREGPPEMFWKLTKLEWSTQETTDWDYHTVYTSWRVYTGLVNPHCHWYTGVGQWNSNQSIARQDKVE